MIELDDKLESIIHQHALAEWEAKPRAEIESRKRRVLPPKEFRRELESMLISPLAVRWRRRPTLVYG